MKTNRRNACTHTGIVRLKGGEKRIERVYRTESHWVSEWGRMYLLHNGQNYGDETFLQINTLRPIKKLMPKLFGRLYG